MSLERYILVGENDPWRPKLALHPFRATLDAFLFDGRSGAECERAIEWGMNQNGVPYELTTNDKADIVATLAYIQGGADDFEKMERADNFYRILIAAVSMAGSPDAEIWYATQASMRAKFNWSDPD